MDETIYKRSKQGLKVNTGKKSALQLTWRGQSISMTKRVSIGRDKCNSIALDDPLVSRKHAIIEKRLGTYYIKDLESTNGTYVNKNPLLPGEEKKLQPGSVINIGKSEFKII